MSMFKPSVRKSVKLKLGITGPSGSGKTYSALLVAKGLGGKIAVLDTENDSASLYSGNSKLPQFDSLSISPPFTVQKYIDAIDGAAKGGYNVLIIDSLTHEWNGSGGLLEQKEAMDKRGGNQYANWATITKQHERFVSAILHSQIHIIGTMRSKQEYAQEKDANGRTRIQKLGMAPIQRDGLEYELSVVFDMDEGHGCQVSKDRTGLFTRAIFTPSEETGKILNEWLMSGAPIPEPIKEELTRPLEKKSETKAEPKKPDDRTVKIMDLVRSRNIMGSFVSAELNRLYDKTKISELTDDEFPEFYKALDTATQPTHAS